MAKKAKKETAVESDVPTNEGVEQTPAKEKLTRPTRFLHDVNTGLDYKFDVRKELPKKAQIVGTVSIDGTDTPFQVTSSKGFSPEGKTISYSWLTLPDGTKGFITHDYEVTPVAGTCYTVGSGKPNRTNPERVAKNDTVGALRIEKFKESYAKRTTTNAATPSDGSEATPA